MVDDFGINYTGLQHLQYLLETLQQFYNLAMYWSGMLFCNITLTWDYDKWTGVLSMPTYITKTCTKFQHPMPFHPQHFPCKHPHQIRCPGSSPNGYYTRCTTQTHARNCGHLIILLLCHEPHLGLCIELNGSKTNTWDSISAQCMPSITPLHCHASSCCHMLPSQ